MEDLIKCYKLSRPMVGELKRMTRVQFITWSNASLRALVRRGLAQYINDEIYREGWQLTEEGKRVASLL